MSKSRRVLNSMTRGIGLPFLVTVISVAVIGGIINV